MTVRTRRFSGGALAARQARRAVRERARGTSSPTALLGDVELLVSELATNSVRHGGSDEAGELAIEADVLSDGRARARVCDHGQRLRGAPARAAPERGRPGGYGLVLLDRLSDRWGVQRDDGFCVWFELSRPARAEHRYRLRRMTAAPERPEPSSSASCASARRSTSSAGRLYRWAFVAARRGRDRWSASRCSRSRARRSW